MSKYIFRVFLVFPFLLNSQTNPSKQKLIDSLTLQLKQDSIEIYSFKKIRPYLNYHERNSIENPKTINFFGPQMGVVLFENHILGFGWYHSSPNTKKPNEVTDENNVVTREINIKYLTFFYQYILVRKRFIELHFPFEIGRGLLHSAYRDNNNELYKTTTNYFTIAGAGTQVILKPVKWIGLSLNLGYRLATESIINGSYYSVGVWIGFKPVMTDVTYYLIKRKKYRREIKKLIH